MRRVTASTQRRDAKSVGQRTLGGYRQHQANLVPRPKFDKYPLADPVVPKPVDKRLGIDITYAKRAYCVDKVEG